MSLSGWRWERQVLLQTVLWNVWWSLCGLQSVWEGEGPKTLLSYFWVAGPSPSSKSVFALFPLKKQLPHSVSLALVLLSIFWHLLFFPSLLMKLMLTHRLRTHTLTDSADCNDCCLAPLMILLSWFPPGPCVVSEVSWRTAWHCISWAPGWDEVSEQAEKCDLKVYPETRVCC